MKFHTLFYLLFSIPLIFAQTASMVGPIGGINTNNFGIGIMYRKHLNNYFYLEGAYSMPCLAGYESIMIPNSSPTNFETKYYWTYGSFGLNLGVNSADYRPRKHNIGFSAGFNRVFGPDEYTTGTIFGASLNYSCLLSNHWNLELTGGIGALRDFEETYTIPIFGVKYSKTYSKYLKNIPKEDRIPLFNPQPPDYRTVITASAGVSPLGIGLSIQQYFTGFMALELGLGPLSANTNLKIYPINGFDGIIDPYIGADMGLSWFEELVPLNYFMFGLEIKPRFGGYENGYRFGIDVGPIVYYGEAFLGLNLRLSKAFNDRF